MKYKLVSLSLACILLLVALSTTYAQSPIAPPEIPGKAVYIPFPVEIKLDDLLNAVLAEDNWYAEVAVADAVFTIELNTYRKYPFLVAHY